MSTGTIVLGLLNGLTTGLLAIGLVLIYRANRFLNLAHAQMGTLSALLVAKWVLDWHWSFWVAFGLAILVGAVIGLAVDRLVVGRLRRRGGTPVRLLLLSVAVSQVLLAFTFVPHLSPHGRGASLYPQPFTSHASIGHVVLSGMTVLTAIVVPLLTLALAVFLRYTGLGKAIRAAASNPDAARLCGVPVGRVSAITWAIAGGLSAVSAVLQAPNQASFNAAALGPYLLMLTLGAAAFGAFVSIPAALGGGILLGLVSQIVAAERASSADAELAVFATVLLVVLVRGRQIGQVFSLGGGIGDALPPVRVPAALQSNPLLRRPILWTVPLTLLLAVALPTLPYFRTEAHRFLLVLVLLYALIGVGLTMLVGWAGQVSLGHFALVGLGAYLAARWGAHWSLLALIVVAGLIGAAVMAAIGLPALRVGGLALAVTTTGLAVISPDWLFQQSWVGSADPFVTVPKIGLGFGLGTPQSMFALYLVALVTLTLAVTAAASLRRYGPGRVVIAVRDNEPAASAFGLNPPTVKLAILAVSGFFAAAAGVLWADTWGVISTPQFTPELSVGILAIPIVGGLGSIGGAVVAGVALYMATFFIGPHVSGLFGTFGHDLGFQLFLAGLTEIGVLLQAPRGIAGAAQQRWQAFLDRRALLVDRWTAPTPATDDASEGVSAGASMTGAIAVRQLTPVHRAEPAGGAAALAADGALVRFGGIIALDRPALTVGAGEVVGLIGPNGAGKTTLMNVISGILRPSEGSVRIAGREVGDLPAAYRAAHGLARTFQDARLFGGLTVTETVQVALAYRHKVGIPAAMVAAPWARATECTTQLEAERIVERFGLTPWAHMLTSELSTGTRRICDLAAQVAAAPRVLLLDEPTAGVAQREAEAFGPLLRRIRDELDCAILIVEHDMPLLMGLCDRVYAMESGRVIAEGTPEQIRADPDVIASYLGNRAAAMTRSGTRAPASR